MMRNVLWVLCCAGCAATPPASADPCDGQTAGTACTWLGTGAEGFNGDGLPRYETQVNQAQDLLFLPDGTAWLSDFNNHIVRSVHTDGTVHTVAGWTDPIFPGDGPLGGIPPGGAAGLDWQLFHPSSMILQSDGTVLLVAWHNHKLLPLDPNTGRVTLRCGGGPTHGGSGFDGDEGPAEDALFNQPSDVTADGEGNLYIVDQLNQRIRLVDESNIVHTFAGTGERGDSGDGGPAAQAQFAWADGSNPNPSGGILHHDDILYIADTDNHRIRTIDLTTRTIATIAGTGQPGLTGDGGPAASATLNGPRDLAIGPEGDLYFADTDNAVVRAIDLQTLVIRTVAGTGELGLDPTELLPATQTQLRRPFGITFDPDGNLYVLDSLNSRILKVAR